MIRALILTSWRGRLRGRDAVVIDLAPEYGRSAAVAHEAVLAALVSAYQPVLFDAAGQAWTFDRSELAVVLVWHVD